MSGSLSADPSGWTPEHGRSINPNAVCRCALCNDAICDGLDPDGEGSCYVCGHEYQCHNEECATDE